MNLALKIIVALVAGTLLGLAAVWLTVVRGNMPGGIADGPWHTSLVTGSPQSDPYTRAAVALHGLFALNRNETIYFNATQDGDGAALDGACRYEITGRDPDARWWSITAYGSDDFLIPNPANRYSLAMTTVTRAPNGTFDIKVGGAPQPANWIATAPGAFSLTLRLYNPGPGAALDPGDTPLPTLKKVGCP